MRLRNVATQSARIHPGICQPGKCVCQLSLLEAYRVSQIEGLGNQKASD